MVMPIFLSELECRQEDLIEETLYRVLFHIIFCDLDCLFGIESKQALIILRVHGQNLLVT